MRNLTQSELEKINSAKDTFEIAVEIDYKLDEDSDYAFFALDGTFITDRIRKVSGKVIYFNAPTAKGKAFIYTF